jgi:predicted RNA-binding Zn-ribbon protein involved in translation (DUF1610 family)
MAFKSRSEPLNLKRMKILNNRMDLTDNEKQYYSNLKKGFEGEMNFDLLTEKLQSEMFILNDLLIETNNSEFQIDSTIITQTPIFLFEVKNYEGEHYYQADKFYTISGKEINNPLHQLNRKETMLRQFLKNHGFHIPIEPYLVFINPNFTFLQAPINPTIILPTQLNRFMEKLNNLPSKLNGMHKKLADQLVAAHLCKSSNSQSPKYEYDQLQKGITCATCNSFLKSVRVNKFVCDECGSQEKIESAVMRSVEEFKILFPDWKITTNSIQEWCKVVESKKMIGRILKQNLRPMGYGQWSFYE